MVCGAEASLGTCRGVAGLGDLINSYRCMFFITGAIINIYGAKSMSVTRPMGPCPKSYEVLRFCLFSYILILKPDS